MASKAIYAGSFDPPTLGHMSILAQASKVFDKIYILVATNPKKSYMFTPEERVEIWERTIDNLEESDRMSVQVLEESKYSIDYAFEVEATHLIRGLRDASDLKEEIAINDINRMIRSDIGTVYFVTAPHLRAVSSSMAKGLIGPNDWQEIVQDLVPEESFDAIEEQFTDRR
jgi:pantetheine-phosphate adenylyltransferase